MCFLRVSARHMKLPTVAQWVEEKGRETRAQVIPFWNRNVGDIDMLRVL